MNQNVQHHSNAWVTFTYASFGTSAFLVAIGVYFLPVDLWIKGYLAMGIVMLVQSCVTLTKTVRDVHESSRFVNRIEDAKAERLLMEVSKGPQLPRPSSFQGRVTCDAVLAKAGGGCFGIRRFPVLRECLTSPTHRLPFCHRNVSHSWLLNGPGAQLRTECGQVAWRLSRAAIRRSVMPLGRPWGGSAPRPDVWAAMACSG